MTAALPQIVKVAIRYRQFGPHSYVTVAMRAPARHQNIVNGMFEKYKVVTTEGDIRGFVTDLGNFINRAEAYELAIANGQTTLLKMGGRTLLQSIDLW